MQSSRHIGSWGPYFGAVQYQPQSRLDFLSPLSTRTLVWSRPKKRKKARRKSVSMFIVLKVKQVHSYFEYKSIPQLLLLSLRSLEFLPKSPFLPLLWSASASGRCHFSKSKYTLLHCTLTWKTPISMFAICLSGEQLGQSHVVTGAFNAYTRAENWTYHKKYRLCSQDWWAPLTDDRSPLLFTTEFQSQLVPLVLLIYAMLLCAPWTFVLFKPIIMGSLRRNKSFRKAPPLGSSRDYFPIHLWQSTRPSTSSLLLHKKENRAHWSFVTSVAWRVIG